MHALKLGGNSDTWTANTEPPGLSANSFCIPFDNWYSLFQEIEVKILSDNGKTRVTIYELRVVSYELRVTSRKLKSTS